MSGCFNVPAPPPAVPPFRLALTGAGFEASPAGRPLRFYEGARNDGWIRLASLSARAFGSDGRRVGRLRPGADGFSVDSREGMQVCSANVDASAVEVACDNIGTWRVAIGSDGMLALLLPDQSVVQVDGDADHATAQVAGGDRVEVTRTGADYAIAFGPWRRSALDARELTDSRSLAVHAIVRAGETSDDISGELVAASVLWATETLLRADREAAAAAEGSSPQ